METGLEEIRGASAQLDGVFQDMNQELAPMREFWVGSGNDSYQAVQQRWNDAMQSMLDVLGRIGNALEQSIQIHSDTERRVDQSWVS